MDSPYIRFGGCFIPDFTLGKEACSMGKWGRMRRDHLIYNG